MPPAENPTYIAVDDDKFYFATTSSEGKSVTALMGEIADHQAEIDRRVALIQGAAAQSVKKATDAITTLTTQPLSATLANATPLKDVLTAQAKVAP